MVNGIIKMMDSKKEFIGPVNIGSQKVMSILDLAKKIVKITNIIRRLWKYDLGFHAHDNLKLAFANAKSAIKADFRYIDSTIMGMGRGAGEVGGCI